MTEHAGWKLELGVSAEDPILRKDSEVAEFFGEILALADSWGYSVGGGITPYTPESEGTATASLLLEKARLFDRFARIVVGSEDSRDAMKEMLDLVKKFQKHYGAPVP